MSQSKGEGNRMRAKAKAKATALGHVKGARRTNARRLCKSEAFTVVAEVQAQEPLRHGASDGIVTGLDYGAHCGTGLLGQYLLQGQSAVKKVELSSTLTYHNQAPCTTALAHAPSILTERATHAHPLHPAAYSIGFCVIWESISSRPKGPS